LAGTISLYGSLLNSATAKAGSGVNSTGNMTEAEKQELIDAGSKRLEVFTDIEYLKID